MENKLQMQFKHPLKLQLRLENYLIVTLISIFLMSHIDPLLVFLLTTCVSLEKHLLNSSAHFYNQLIFFMCCTSSLCICDINYLLDVLFISPGRLQSMELQRVGHDWATFVCIYSLEIQGHSLYYLQL